MRGEGIGFAGVGIKLALLLCEDVVTETRRGKSHVATRWRLASKHKAPWKWEPPSGLLQDRGTAIRIRLSNPLSPLVEPGFVEGVLLRHYRPLLEPSFDELLSSHYPRTIRFEINGRPVSRLKSDPWETVPVEIRLARKRKPSALGYLMRAPHDLPEDQRGLAISTLGKVIRRGWDWLGISPANPDLISGLIDAPPLAECLTLNKAD